jgi:hypothetical protein
VASNEIFFEEIKLIGNSMEKLLFYISISISLSGNFILKRRKNQ